MVIHFLKEWQKFYIIIMFIMFFVAWWCYLVFSNKKYYILLTYFNWQFFYFLLCELIRRGFVFRLTDDCKIKHFYWQWSWSLRICGLFKWRRNLNNYCWNACWVKHKVKIIRFLIKRNLARMHSILVVIPSWSYKKARFMELILNS